MTDSALLPPADVETVFRRLSEAMPGRSERAKGPKGQPDAFRSCISCMLSAQSLDSNTAKACRALFALAQTPAEMLALSDEEIVDAIRPAGLYNNKARAIRKFCRQLLDEHDGIVPDTRKGLLAMHGIGRKCADIVLSFTFGEDAIAVDTHVGRVCDRIGLARGPTEAKIAEILDDRAPDWAKEEGHFWLIQLGKRICKSRRPQCERCPVNDLCQYYGGEADG
ncbi:endonuclease III [Parasphingopyxis algicola]|uniref:endonuclease III domain-containing protein n=1 Tax=Parasphingopyxis algicola TaxID=2026624 RepID=UPI0015A38DFC|nr:endonuclease III [Parasphingopyxis algicola]QLC26259.1 endonuclease III [Parasphingopyxis algicola]